MICVARMAARELMYIQVTKFNMSKIEILDEKTQKHRELMDQIIVEVKDATIEEH
ncbi:MAG: hypothetical protein RI947_878 [Candidatus Parcubacteria bacterium]|jgi:hypothetical protein